MRFDAGPGSATTCSSATGSAAAAEVVDRGAGLRVDGFRGAGFGLAAGRATFSTASGPWPGTASTSGTAGAGPDGVAGAGFVAADFAAAGSAVADFAPPFFAAARLAAAAFAAAGFAAADFAAALFPDVDVPGAGFAAADFEAALPSAAPDAAVRLDPAREAALRAEAPGFRAAVFDDGERRPASTIPSPGTTDDPRSADTPVPVPSGVSSSGPDRETEVTTTTYQLGPPPPPNPLNAAPQVARDETGRPLGVRSRNRHDTCPG
ncbi:MAG TPA: hypothetical protein VF156_00920 [Agromyces sp.]